MGEANKVAVTDAGYSSSTKTRDFRATLTNALNIREIVIVKKEWLDAGDSAGIRPDDLSAYLVNSANSVLLGTSIEENLLNGLTTWVKDDDTGIWQYAFEVETSRLTAGLFVYEDAVEGYSSPHIGAGNKLRISDCVLDADTDTRTWTVTLTNKLNGKVRIRKEANNTGELLEGAEFMLTGMYNGAPVALTSSPVEDEPGIYLIEDVPVGGTYTVSETVAPNGYDFADDQSVTLTEVGEEVELTFVDEAMTATVTVRKEISNYEEYGSELDGQKFIININEYLSTGFGPFAEVALSHDETSKPITMQISDDSMTLNISEIVPYGFSTDYEIRSVVTHAGNPQPAIMEGEDVKVIPGDEVEITVTNTYLIEPYFKARTAVENVFKKGS